MPDPTPEDTIRACVEEAEQALRDIRAVLREERGKEQREASDMLRYHQEERARMVYRLNLQGVPLEQLAAALRTSYANLHRMVGKGEMLENRAPVSDRMEAVLDGTLSLWESGVFPVRIAQCLRRGNIDTLPELEAKTREDLRAIVGMGQKSIETIAVTLAKLGKKLAD